MNITLYLFTIIIMLAGLNQKPKPKDSLISFDFDHPKHRYELPKILREISGITTINDSLIGCVQDELGAFFIYNLQSKTISAKIQFGGKGDYEGVAVSDYNAYILQSDGLLYEILNYKSKSPKVSSFQSGVPALDNEGLHYDKKSKCLLIACKGKFGKGVINQYRREIYAFNIKSRKLNPKPLFTIDIEKIKQFARANNIKLPTKVKNGTTETILKIRISAITIHPKTKQFYILSAFDHALFIFSPSGKIEHLILLNKSIYPQAEGIAFLSNGNLLISNEGGDKAPTIIQLVKK